MNTQRKLSKSPKADTGTGKNYAKFRKTKSLFLALLRGLVLMEKTAAVTLFWFTDCFGYLNSTVPTLFTFALAVSILRVIWQLITRTKERTRKNKCDHEKTESDWANMDCIITQTYGRAFGTLESTFGFLLKLRNLNQVFE